MIEGQGAETDDPRACGSHSATSTLAYCPEAKLRQRCPLRSLSERGQLESIITADGGITVLSHDDNELKLDTRHCDAIRCLMKFYALSSMPNVANDQGRSAEQGDKRSV